ncbi:sensor histidine kinase [Streptomyces griseocarneus]|uniref:sensor histidine kinase n=1 Tax=Streptomyces griseocarneus TaxID=51201 RepID=UPI0019AE9EDB|nr:ATP-binding protein [Streptomyces griseocarneus]MBZ6478153.1 histidine kinase [Streptomyces griseocarneus]GHG84158.1 two-component sensor histidine kinase [Streptomyces griseocarneus]
MGASTVTTSSPETSNSLGLARLEAMVGQGFTRALQAGLSRSHYARTRATIHAPHHLAGGDAAHEERPAHAHALAHAADRTRTRPYDGGDADPDASWHAGRRLARGLHDELGTTLFLVAHHMERYDSGPGDPADLEAARAALREAIKLTEHAVDGLHHATAVPALVPALREFAETTAPAGVRFRIAATGKEALLSDVCRRELFLGIREALRNSFTHSGADEVAVSLRFTRLYVYARVEDDGRGFDAEAPLAPGRSARGLRSMRERLEDLGGRLTIGEAEAGGTRLEIHLPIRPRS